MEMYKAVASHHFDLGYFSEFLEHLTEVVLTRVVREFSHEDFGAGAPGRGAVSRHFSDFFSCELIIKGFTDFN
jgi:hypothetical protein